MGSNPRVCRRRAEEQAQQAQPTAVSFGGVLQRFSIPLFWAVLCLRACIACPPAPRILQLRRPLGDSVASAGQRTFVRGTPRSSIPNVFRIPEISHHGVVSFLLGRAIRHPEIPFLDSVLNFAYHGREL